MSSKLRDLTTAELSDRILNRWRKRHEEFLRCPLKAFDEPVELVLQRFQALGRSGCEVPQSISTRLGSYRSKLGRVPLGVEKPSPRNVAKRPR